MKDAFILRIQAGQFFADIHGNWVIFLKRSVDEKVGIVFVNITDTSLLNLVKITGETSLVDLSNNHQNLVANFFEYSLIKVPILFLIRNFYPLNMNWVTAQLLIDPTNNDQLFPEETHIASQALKAYRDFEETYSYQRQGFLKAPVAANKEDFLNFDKWLEEGIICEV